MISKNLLDSLFTLYFTTVLNINFFKKYRVRFIFRDRFSFTFIIFQVPNGAQLKTKG